MRGSTLLCVCLSVCLFACLSVCLALRLDTGSQGQTARGVLFLPVAVWKMWVRIDLPPTLKVPGALWPGSDAPLSRSKSGLKIQTCCYGGALQTNKQAKPLFSFTNPNDCEGWEWEVTFSCHFDLITKYLLDKTETLMGLFLFFLPFFLSIAHFWAIFVAEKQNFGFWHLINSQLEWPNWRQKVMFHHLW